jgi:hypothetical protein
MFRSCLGARRLVFAVASVVLAAGASALGPSLATAGVVKALGGTAGKRSSVATATAQTPASHHYGGPTRSLGVHVAPTRQALRKLSNTAGVSAAAATKPTNVKNLGGPMMSDVTIYNIFWVPDPANAPNESLINRFTEDLGGQFVNLLGQYGFSNQLGFGGSWVDTDALPDRPKASSSGYPILQDSDIQSVITAAQNANALWQAPSLSTLYMVYLPEHTELCNPTIGCTYTGDFCAYHGAYVDDADPNIPIVYGAMPYDGDRMGGCSTGGVSPPDYNGSDGPNGDPATDSEISTASHEIFESLTDPEALTNPAWTDGANPVDPHTQRVGEIGDLCAYIYNPDGYGDGGDITLNGDRYFLQYEWDNATSSCVLPGGAILPTSHYAGCTANTLAANDDGSSPQVTLPFSVNYYGSSYSSAYVNNNGNLTFTNALATFSPFPLLDSQLPIIAPFFADVDTTGNSPVPSGLVTYGNTTYQGQPAFCVNWRNVGYFAGQTDKLDSFQLLLVKRPDAGSGDFDIVYNYDRVQWDTGSAAVEVSARPAAQFGGGAARVGYSNGTTNSLELAGSGQPGQLVDYGEWALTVGDQGSTQPGRYIFPVRAGQDAGPDTLAGQVTDTATPADPIAGAQIQACQQLTVVESCALTSTNAAGYYSIAGLADSFYAVTASPPAGSSLQPQEKSVLPDFAATTTLNFALTGPPPPPPGVTVDGVSVNPDGTPVIYWQDPTPIFYSGGCSHGTATWSLTAENTMTNKQQTVQGTMVESPAGSGDYAGSIPPVYPMHGQGTLSIGITCPNPSNDETLSLTIYIDPSGTVVDTHGNRVPGATVTLLRADTPSGQFTAVPNGSPLMSPGNRRNPDVTGADGSFGWDVLTGYYEIRAKKPGCSDPASPGNDYVVSQPVEIPPAVSGLKLVLSCPQAPTKIPNVFSPGGQAGQPAQVAATLQAADGAPLASRTLTFSLPGGADCTARTDAAGAASCSLTPNQAAGQYPLTASFAGDWADAPSSGTAPFTVTGGPSTLASTSTQPATSASAAAGTLRIRTPIRVTAGGAATIAVSCTGPKGAVCAGRLLLTRTLPVAQGARGHGKHPKRTIGVGSVTYRVRAGSAATLRVRISRALLATLRAAGRRGITVTVTVPGPAGRPVTRTVRLVASRPASHARRPRQT